MIDDAMYGYARMQIALARMDGHKIDKKQARINDIVEASHRYGMLGTKFSNENAWQGLREVIDACLIGNEMHVPGGSVRDIVPDWMIAYFTANAAEEGDECTTPTA